MFLPAALESASHEEKGSYIAAALVDGQLQLGGLSLSFGAHRMLTSLLPHEQTQTPIDCLVMDAYASQVALLTASQP